MQSLKVYIGDFKTLKEVFNHPDVQGRANPQIHEVNRVHVSDPNAVTMTVDCDPNFSVLRRAARSTWSPGAAWHSRKHRGVVVGAEKFDPQSSQGRWLWQGWHGGGHCRGARSIHSFSENIFWETFRDQPKVQPPPDQHLVEAGFQWTVWVWRAPVGGDAWEGDTALPSHQLPGGKDYVGLPLDGEICTPATIAEKGQVSCDLGGHVINDAKKYLGSRDYAWHEHAKGLDRYGRKTLIW